MAAILLVLAAVPSRLVAQGTGGPTFTESSVGYIDPAIPGNSFRMRFDAAYGSDRSSRAEYFYPRTGPAGPGLPLAETNVDFQTISAYMEVAPTQRLSVFFEAPVRILNPEVNANADGIGDLNAGFKYAFLHSECLVATFQLRAYFPTGEADRGLGTDHVSLEPAILAYSRLTDRLSLESELRLWVPIDGTDFAGELIQYGVGVSYGLWETECLALRPVAEVVGWTVLDGKTNVPLGPGLAGVVDASGDTIVNLKLGLRLTVGDRGDIYAGYGRALTDDVWYEDIFRVEFRLSF